MLLIAGIAPKTKRLEQHHRLCPVCGLAQAYVARIDHYVSLFFIPILRVKKGTPFIMCARCEKPISESGLGHNLRPPRPGALCPSCGKVLKPDFTYCPSCGQKV